MCVVGPDAGPPVDAGTCGPWNCQGCCTAAGVCVSGQGNQRCGVGGQQCVNCTTNGGTCDAGQCVYPNTCPAPYGGCPSYETVTPPYTKTNVCSQDTLNKVVMACAGTPTPPGCELLLSSLQQSDPACGQCLWQFVGPNAPATCVAPYLSDTCNHQVACTFDCLNVACAQCPTDQSQTCRDDALASGGTCAGYTQGALCYQSALQQASFCNWPGDYGKWIYMVGNHYCGTGAP